MLKLVGMFQWVSQMVSSTITLLEPWQFCVTWKMISASQSHQGYHGHHGHSRNSPSCAGRGSAFTNCVRKLSRVLGSNFAALLTWAERSASSPPPGRFELL